MVCLVAFPNQNHGEHRVTPELIYSCHLAACGCCPPRQLADDITHIGMPLGSLWFQSHVFGWCPWGACGFNQYTYLDGAEATYYFVDGTSLYLRLEPDYLSTRTCLHAWLTWRPLYCNQLVGSQRGLSSRNWPVSTAATSWVPEGVATINTGFTVLYPPRVREDSWSKVPW